MPKLNETIHVIFKTHLDIGFTDFASKVFETYFEVFIPTAISTARQLRAQNSADRFIWTTGSWLIYEYLEHANSEKRKELETAIEAGDIVWHGLPFTTHTELMSASLFKHGLGLSQDLDKRFGKATISAKMTDVPGHTRGMIPMLAEAGIKFLHLGANEASTPPDVPPVFVWHDKHRNSDVTVMYQKSGYGGFIRLPNFNHTLAFAHTNDNHGAQSLEEVQTLFRTLREKYPDANVIGSTMDAFAAELSKAGLDLPIIEQEMGDTWIQGVGSDPLKVSSFRELDRLRQSWIQSGDLQYDRRMIAFSNKLILIPEHTWGMDEKVHLKDYAAYARKQFDVARHTAVFQRFESSWTEQRAYIDDAVNALGDLPQASEAKAHLKSIQPIKPNIEPFKEVHISAKPYYTPIFEIGFDTHTGAINHLIHRPSGRQWASSDKVLGLFRYQTFSETDYAYYWKHYIINKRKTKVWSWDDNMKPGMESVQAESRFWLPTVQAVYMKADQQETCYLLRLEMEKLATEQYGAPKVVFVMIRCDHNSPKIHLEVQWFEKAANRLPEAIWLSFNPITRTNGKWIMDKLGTPISPLEVIRNGNRKLHAVESGLTYTDRKGTLKLGTLDAPLVAPGKPALLHFNNSQPKLQNGMHFNLFNNVWGTNFPMWYGDDARFRYELSFASTNKA